MTHTSLRPRLKPHLAREKKRDIWLRGKFYRNHGVFAPDLLFLSDECYFHCIYLLQMTGVFVFAIFLILAFVTYLQLFR